MHSADLQSIAMPLFDEGSEILEGGGETTPMKVLDAIWQEES